MRGNEDHQVVGETRVLQTHVIAAACDLLRSLQHLVNLVEIQIAEQRADHTTLRNALLARCLQDQLQDREHIIILDPLRHLLEQRVMSHIVEVGSQIQIDDQCLTPCDPVGHSFHRFMSCSLRSISKGSRLEVCLKDRLQNELQRTLDDAVTDRGDREDANFLSVATLRDLVLPIPQRTIRA